MGVSVPLVVMLSASWACASETIERLHARQATNRLNFFIKVKNVEFLGGIIVFLVWGGVIIAFLVTKCKDKLPSSDRLNVFFLRKSAKLIYKKKAHLSMGLSALNLMAKLVSLEVT